jgi:hypothetical protein
MRDQHQQQRQKVQSVQASALKLASVRWTYRVQQQYRERSYFYDTISNVDFIQWKIPKMEFGEWKKYICIYIKIHYIDTYMLILYSVPSVEWICENVNVG